MYTRYDPDYRFTDNYFQEKMLLKSIRFSLPSFQFCGLLAALGGSFLMGGSSREDVQSIAILNPLMILFCGAAFSTLREEHWRGRAGLLWVIGLLFLLVTLYVVPLPLPVEANFIGGDDVADIRAAADITKAPQTLALAPYLAKQSLFFLFAPLAVLLFAMQLDRADMRLTLPLLIILGTISGVIGVLQLAGGPSGPFYFYRITNNSNAVGLFANRNHAAILLACLFPMLALFALRSSAVNGGSTRIRRLIALSIAITVVPLILVTGSRSGLLAAVIGLVGGLLLYTSRISTSAEIRPIKSVTAILMATTLLCLVFVTIYFSRAEAIERIFADPSAANDRAAFWISTPKLFWLYFPFGFGPGSFVPAFQVEETLFLLTNIYVNRLHNDWLETALTFGVPGMLLLTSATAYYVRRTYLLWTRMEGARSAVAMGRMASIIIAIFAIASMSDYPLRTPAMMGFAALVLVWFIEARREPAAAINKS